MKKRDSLRRRNPSRAPKQRFLIVCEGTVTEPCYFRQLRHLLRSLIELVIIPGGDPKTLVERAVEKKAESYRAAHRQGDAYLAYDQVWCVCDVDEHKRLPAALQQARDNGINMAVSNPSFELWALLHFADQTAHIEREKARALCKKHMPRYDKELPCDVLMPRYPDARQRAVKLEQWHESRDTAGSNPSTGVYLLVEQIRVQAGVGQ